MSAPATKEAAAAEGNPIGGILKKTGETIADAVHHGIEGLASTDETAHMPTLRLLPRKARSPRVLLDLPI
jgi:hypothetical protein